MIYEAQYYLTSFLLLPFIKTVTIMTLLIVMFSTSNQQHFDFFFQGSVFPGAGTRLIHTNYDKSLLSKPTLLLDG